MKKIIYTVSFMVLGFSDSFSAWQRCVDRQSILFGQQHSNQLPTSANCSTICGTCGMAGSSDCLSYCTPGQ